MSELIDRQEAIEACMKYNGQGYIWSLIMKEIERLPSAQPKRGRWIHDGSKWTNRWICSECGYKWFFDCIEGAYCPNCGAKMEGADDE